MFTGIIEGLGIVHAIEFSGSNCKLTIESPFKEPLKIDQSVAHNGACLTVTSVIGNLYTVTAIAETLLKTNLSKIRIGDYLNLERAMALGDRLDGHLVQGHVDQTGICEKIVDRDGSWDLYFSYAQDPGNITIEKGSICVNGISLTVVNSQPGKFSVSVIPYTWENTNLRHLKESDSVNLEFDMIGKYLTKLASIHLKR